VQVVHVYIIPHVKICMVSNHHPVIDVIVELVILVGIVKLVRENIKTFFFSTSLSKKAIVTSCERTPCIHGQCLKIDLYTEICICEDHWIGVDCSQPLTSKHSNINNPLHFIRNLFPISSSTNDSFTCFNSNI
jgi:hypothetical protein